MPVKKFLRFGFLTLVLTTKGLQIILLTTKRLLRFILRTTKGLLFVLPTAKIPLPNYSEEEEELAMAISASPETAENERQRDLQNQHVDIVSGIVEAVEDLSPHASVLFKKLIQPPLSTGLLFPFHLLQTLVYL